jgi:ribosomal protein S18 acetylase RimI-like enzyme
MMSAVTEAAPGDIERAVSVMLLAFSADPISRWAHPDPHQYVTCFPAIVRAFGCNAFAQGTAWQADEWAGAALWLPPGVSPDEAALKAMTEASVSPERQAEVFGLFEQMGNYHPHEPHWYLPLIGVDPVHRNRGLGSALLQQALRRCDQQRMPAYLESTNPANIPLYERHGFRILGTIQVGTSPPMVPMLRPAR